MHGVEHEVPIGVVAGREVLDLLPLGHALVRRHDQAQRITGAEHRRVRGAERLAGHALGDAERLVLDDIGVDRVGGAADGVGDQPVDHRCRVYAGWPSTAATTRARSHPARSPSITAAECCARHVDDDRTVAVQPAGAVLAHVARVPVGAVERLPLQRRVVGVDTDALDRAAELQPHRASRHGIGQPDHQRVAGLRCVGEGGERHAQAQLVGVIDTNVL